LALKLEEGQKVSFRSINMKTFALVVLLCLVSGCTKVEDDGTQRSADSPTLGLCGENLRVTNGKTCEELHKSSIALLQIEIDGKSAAICTGTLISTKTIITAAHCLDRKQGVTGLLVGFPDTASDSAKKNFEVYRVASFEANPKYDSVPGNPYDVGLVILETEVTSRQTIPLVGRDAHIASSGDTIGIYGFGKNEVGDIGTLRYGKMILESFDTGLAYKDDLLGAAFDKTKQSICSGDSGGPAGFSARTGYGILAINSVGTSERCMESDMAGFANLQLDENLNFVLEKKEGTIGILGSTGVSSF
jgi:tryptase